MYLSKTTKKVKSIKAGEEVMIQEEATDLLFEAEDVAELIAEVSCQDVEVAADEDQVVFTVGEEEYTVEPEGDEEILESCSTKGKKAVKASKKVPAGRKQVRRVVKRSR